jgi:hypothetical protein
LTVTPPKAALWTGADLAADPSWRVEIDATQRDDLCRATDAVLARKASFADVDRSSFALPSWTGLIARARHDVEDGRGFVLLRGLPVERYGPAELEILFWGLGAHLGIGVTQTAAADLIAHVTDKGPVEGLRRGFQTNREAKFHVDLADAVGLLCLRQAKSGGRSLLLSSATVHEILRREHPDAMAILARGFAWDRREEHGPGEDPVGPVVPVLGFHRGRFRAIYNRNFNETVFKRRGVAMPPEERDALDALDAVIAREDLQLPMDFQPGDVQLVSNETVLHARTEYEDDPTLRRHLLRLWWNFDRYVDDPPIRPLPYGRLGRSASHPAL